MGIEQNFIGKIVRPGNLSSFGYPEIEVGGTFKNHTLNKHRGHNVTVRSIQLDLILAQDEKRLVYNICYSLAGGLEDCCFLEVDMSKYERGSKVFSVVDARKISEELKSLF